MRSARARARASAVQVLPARNSFNYKFQFSVYDFEKYILIFLY